MDHKVIIQRNFTYLKEDLSVNGCRDYMFQTLAFTKDEYDQSKNNVNIFLDILMRKGSSGYKEFVAALDKTGQAHVKQRLDQTCEETGLIDLLYVNKEEIERVHRRRIADSDRRISDLENDIKQKNKDITHISDENGREKQEMKEVHEKKISDLDQKMTQKANELEHFKQKMLEDNLDIQRRLNDTEEERTRLEEELSALNKAFQELTERYDAITPSTSSELTTLKRVKYPQEASKDDTCGLCHKSFSEEESVYLLPCLHKTCLECKDNHHHPEEGQCSICLTRFQPESLKPDPARQSKIFLQTLKRSGSCGYNISHDKEPPVCYCQNCECTLCASCQSLHSQTTICLQHQIYDFEDIHQVPPQEILKKEFCPVRDHAHATLDLYDKDCRRNICLICAQADHKDHSMVNIGEAYSSAKEQLEESLQDLQNKSKVIQGRIQEAHDLEAVIGTMVATLMDIVAKTRESLTCLLLRREKQVRDDITRCSEPSKLAIAEVLHRLYQMKDSVETTMEFIEMIRDFCSKADFLDLKTLAEEKAHTDLDLQLPRVDRRSAQMNVSIVGLRALEHQISTFMSLYSVPQESGYDVVPDDVPTTTEFQSEIRKLEETIRSLNNDLEKTTKLMDTEKSDWMVQDLKYRSEFSSLKDVRHKEKHDHLLQLEVVKQNLQTEKQNNVHLRDRCLDLERGLSDKMEKIKTLEQKFEKARQKARDETTRIQKQYKQIEQIFEQKLVCVARHRGEHENCMIECSKITFAVERLDECIGTIIDGVVLTNRPSESQIKDRSQTFKKYMGTVSLMPIYPAPCRFHQYPAYWEYAVDVELLRELRLCDIIWEIGVVAESSLDAYTLVFREKHAWCLVLRFCRSHENICLQIWRNGTYVSCSSDVMPNRRGDSKALKFGGVFEAQNCKLSFLDLTKDAKLATFDLESESPLFLTFGFPPRCEHARVHFRLMSPCDLNMLAEKKNLILSALR